MELLVVDEFGDMAEHGFEGSNEEYLIFMEVFYGIMNSHPETDQESKALVNYSYESSSVSSLSSLKDFSSVASDIAEMDIKEKTGLSLLESSSSLVGSDANLNAALINLSSSEALKHKSKDSCSCCPNIHNATVNLELLNVAENLTIESSDSCGQVQCRLVESFDHDILSSYFMFSPQEEIDGFYEDIVPKNEIMNQHIGDDGAFTQTKSITISNVQGLFHPKIIVPSVNLEESTQVLASSNQIFKGFDILDASLVNVEGMRDFIKDLPNRLRSHALLLLIEAGWNIKTRNHKGKTALDCIYKSPGGGTLFSLQRAWISCGECLFSNELVLEMGENVRCWFDIDAFWGDLTDILQHIENEIWHRENSLSLINRWRLLDPFMAVVCIDKKIHALREGRALKAVKSATSFLDDNDNSDLVEAVDDKAHLEAKSDTSLSPQKTCSHGLLVSDTPFVLEEVPLACICLNQRYEKFNMDSDTIDDGRKKAFVKDLPNSLRSHALRLLKNAGWKISSRQRETGKVDYVYKPPSGGMTLYSLSRAWKSCGQKLLSNQLISKMDDNGKQWTGIYGFWADLTETLAFLEKKVHHMKRTVHLLQRWQLLDPFMAVVWIDRKLGALQGGETLKAVKSATIILSENKNPIMVAKSKGCAQKQNAGLLNSCALPNFSEVNVPVLVSSDKCKVSQSSSQQIFAKSEYHKSRSNDRYVRMEHKFFHGAECRSIKSLSKRIGKGSRDVGDVHDMIIKSSSSQPKMRNQLYNDHTSLQKQACKTCPTGLIANDNLPQVSLTSHSSPSTSHVPRSKEIGHSRKFVGRKFGKNVASSGSNEKFLEENLRHKRATTDQPVIYQKEKRLRPERDGHNSVGVLAHENTPCSSVEAVAQLGRLDSSTLHGCSTRRILCFEDGHEIGVPLGSSLVTKKANIYFLEEGLTDIAHKSTITSGDINCCFTLSQTCDHQMQEQQVQFLYPKEGVPHSRADDICIKELFACVNSHDAIRGGDLAHNVQSSSYEARLMNSVSDFGTSSVLHNTEFSVPHGEFISVPQEDPAFDEKIKALNLLKLPEYQKEKTDGAFVESNLAMVGRSMQKPASDSTKKLHKFKKMPEIKAANINRKFVEAHLLSGNCKDLPAFRKSGKPGSKIAKGCVKDKNDNVPILVHDESGRTLLQSNRDKEKRAHLKLEICSHEAMNEYPQRSPSVDSSHLIGISHKKVQYQSSDFIDPVVASAEGNPLKLHYENNSVKYSEINCDSVDHAGAKDSCVHKENGRKKLHRCRIDDNDLLVSAIIKKKYFRMSGKHYASRAGNSRSKSLRKLKSQNGSVRSLLRSPGERGIPLIDGKKIIPGPKTVMSWLMEMGIIYLNDYIQYRNPANNAVVKDGQVTRGGILCNCCNNVLSLSEFKFHAGFKVHKPCLNLFMESGKPFILCQLQGWSAEYKARKCGLAVMEGDKVEQSDDTCRHCGDGGEIICCDGCPSTYHQACLPSQNLAEGSWYCPKCICGFCGGIANVRETSGSVFASECSQCENTYHIACVKEKVTCTGEMGSDNWFCGQNCNKVYIGLRSRVGVLNNCGDGFSWTILRCSHAGQKVHSVHKIALMAECNTKLAVALNIVEQCFLPMVDPRTGINLVSHVLYNLGSTYPHLNYRGFYTVVLEKGDELVSVASIRVHGIILAEMPLIATCPNHRRQGMCRRLIGAIEKMLKYLKVEMLVLLAVPDIVDTWSSGFGFQPIEDDEKQRLISNITLVSFPGTVLLKKRLY